MGKSTVGVRLSDEVAEGIDSLVESGLYSDRSQFIREAVKEKLYPNYKEDRRQRKLSAILTDPDIPDDIKKAVRERQSS